MKTRVHEPELDRKEGGPTPIGRVGRLATDRFEANGKMAYRMNGTTALPIHRQAPRSRPTL